MPQILVVTDSADASAGTVVYRERISIADLRSGHFSGQLVERVSWAVGDASELERRYEDPSPRRSSPPPAAPTSQPTRSSRSTRQPPQFAGRLSA
ncbi:MAG TPA: hypothetical protein VJ204_07415 [Solirubrobacterales bacterium]|nr:hypothetical protein [Solirubrobacterales bacterium]